MLSIVVPYVPLPTMCVAGRPGERFQESRTSAGIAAVSWDRHSQCDGEESWRNYSACLIEYSQQNSCPSLFSPDQGQLGPRSVAKRKSLRKGGIKSMMSRTIAFLPCPHTHALPHPSMLNDHTELYPENRHIRVLLILHCRRCNSGASAGRECVLWLARP